MGPSFTSKEGLQPNSKAAKPASTFTPAQSMSTSASISLSDGRVGNSSVKMIVHAPP